MLRKTLIATALLAASTGAMAHGEYVYGRVVTVEPSFSITVNSGSPYDGFRVMYEVGGQNYWTYSRYQPGPVIWVPRPVVYRMPPHKFKHYYRGGWYERRHERWEDHRGGRGGWGDRDDRRYREW